jgi:hypothetical protein
MAVEQLPFEHLLVIVLCFIIAIAFVFINGISLKLGDKEVAIGGLKRLFAKRDADVFVKERLKKQIDEIDESMTADVSDLIDAMSFKFEQLLVNKHCWFTMDKFIGLIKRALFKRVRRNNLKIKLCESNKAKYVEQILGEVKAEYRILQIKAAAVQCHDQYMEFTVIEPEVREVLGTFFDETHKIVISKIREKIKLYEIAQSEFKTPELRKQSCDIPIQKNRQYMTNLEAI